MSREIDVEDFVESKVDEIEEILDDYDVFPHDTEAIVGIVREIGQLLKDAVEENRKLNAKTSQALSENG